VSYGVGCRPGLDLALLWLAAVARIKPLAWELPYAEGAALKIQKEKKKELPLVSIGCRIDPWPCSVG